MRQESRKIHIITVGVSILSNYRKGHPELPSLDKDKEYAKWLQPPYKNKIIEFVKANPYQVSAELNSMREFIEREDVTHFHLIVTKTNACEICAYAVGEFLREKGIKPLGGKRYISGYYGSVSKVGHEEAGKEFIKGLQDLFAKVIRLIQRHKNTAQIRINATGGFKPEVAVLSLIGSLTRTPVYYIHEGFKSVVHIPPIFTPFVEGEVYRVLKLIQQKKRLLRRDALKLRAPMKKAMQDALYLNLIEEKKDREGLTKAYVLSPSGKFLLTIRKEFENA